MADNLPTVSAPKPYLLLPEMTWPNPVYAQQLNNKLRYADSAITREDHLVLASICDAYNELIRSRGDKRARVVRLIRAALDVSHAWRKP